MTIHRFGPVSKNRTRESFYCRVYFIEISMAYRDEVVEIRLIIINTGIPVKSATISVAAAAAAAARGVTLIYVADDRI